MPAESVIDLRNNSIQPNEQYIMVDTNELVLHSQPIRNMNMS